MRTCSRIRPDWSASCSAKASGAFREPGHSTTSRTPPRINSSTTTRAWVVDGFTSTGCHNPGSWRFYAGKELQRCCVDGLGPLQEAEVAGVRDLQIAAVGHGVGDLAA